MGTLVSERITNVYEKGVRHQEPGRAVFRVLEMILKCPKIYSGAIVNYPDNLGRNRELMIKL